MFRPYEAVCDRLQYLITIETLNSTDKGSSPTTAPSTWNKQEKNTKEELNSIVKEDDE